MEKYRNMILQEEQNITPKIAYDEPNCRVNVCPTIPLE